MGHPITLSYPASARLGHPPRGLDPECGQALLSLFSLLATVGGCFRIDLAHREPVGPLSLPRRPDAPEPLRSRGDGPDVLAARVGQPPSGLKWRLPVGRSASPGIDTRARHATRQVYNRLQPLRRRWLPRRLRFGAVLVRLRLLGSKTPLAGLPRGGQSARQPKTKRSPEATRIDEDGD